MCYIQVTIWVQSALSWDPMLSLTEVELKVDLISDSDMYLFFKKDTRAGFSYVSKWCSKANSKCLKSYDPKQD